MAVGVLAAVAGRDLARATQYAAEHGIERAVEGYQTLINDPDLDAVYIPLPNALHAEWTGQALRAGKPVLCEKPLCGSLAETEQVLAVARETGTPLWEAFVFPFHEQMTKIRGLLADGAIGELREIQANFAFVLDHPGDFRLRRGMAGGALNDIGCYPVRLAVELFTGELESAWATGRWAATGWTWRPAGQPGLPGHQRLTVSCSFLRSATGSPGWSAPPGRSTSPTLTIRGRTTRSRCSRRTRNRAATPRPTRCRRSPPRSGTSSGSSGARRHPGTWQWTTRCSPPGPCTRCTRPRRRISARIRISRTRGRPGGPPAAGSAMTSDSAGRLPPGAAAAIRDALAAERQQTQDRITAVSREFDGIVESSAGVATDDEHDPEGATIAFERAQLAALIDQARSHLAELDDALDRLREGSYGRCERCGRPIAAERLAARPAARTCITCAAAN